MTTTTTAPQLLEALNEALQVAQAAALEPWDRPHGDCGFAWVAIKMRKNARLSKVLAEFGFHWSDYYKRWEFAPCNAVENLPGTLWQSIAYRYKIAYAFANHVAKRVDISPEVCGRVD